MCRSAIYQYEHITPEFSDATEHNPDNICLLCGGCHDRVSRGRISKETVRARYEAIQRTEEIKRPFENLDLSKGISVSLGSAQFFLAKCLLRINGEDILSITSPQGGAGFPTISGVFYDRKGRELFRITDNVWEGPLDVWDIEVSGKSVTIKSDNGKISLRFIIAPPNKIMISQLDMYKDNCHIMCDERQILIGQIMSSGHVYFGLGSFECWGAKAGISVDSRSIDKPSLQVVEVVGGQGIRIKGTGIQVGVGSPSMLISEMRVWNA
jgi:hypothetical protein